MQASPREQWQKTETSSPFADFIHHPASPPSKIGNLSFLARAHSA